MLTGCAPSDSHRGIDRAEEGRSSAHEEGYSADLHLLGRLQPDIRAPLAQDHPPEQQSLSTNLPCSSSPPSCYPYVLNDTLFSTKGIPIHGGVI